MSIVSEFREFIERGNVIDLAVGVIFGASFNAIVKSLVDQVVMPPLGLLTGAFINTVIQFLIVAWVGFLLVKLVNSVRRREAEKPPEAKPQPTATEVLLMEIRDQLKAQNAAAGATPAPPGAGSTAP